ncbi:MAG: hypothetical protein ACRCYY_10270 [Trueperaceae bacterium]
MKALRWLLLLGVVLLGISTLLASMGPLPPDFEIITNNYEDSYGSYGLTSKIVFACRNKKVLVSWTVTESNGVILTAVPLGRLSPDFNRQKPGKSGYLETVVLGELELGLESTVFDATVAFKLLPEDICTSFPINLIANCDGTLYQTVSDSIAFCASVSKRIVYGQFSMLTRLILGKQMWCVSFFLMMTGSFVLKVMRLIQNLSSRVKL